MDWPRQAEPFDVLYSSIRRRRSCETNREGAEYGNRCAVLKNRFVIEMVPVDGSLEHKSSLCFGFMSPVDQKLCPKVESIWSSTRMYLLQYQ